jgi:hypothetical protein
MYSIIHNMNVRGKLDLDEFDIETNFTEHIHAELWSQGTLLLSGNNLPGPYDYTVLALTLIQCSCHEPSMYTQ